MSARSLEAPELAAGLARLARRGGAVLEPWLERVADYATELHVDADGTLTVLGILEQHTTASGVYRGHRGELDHRGRVVSGGAHDDALLAAAADVARAAHAEGFHGPCGVDAFAFEHEGRRLLRPVVELNARFTMGTVVLGLLRRARPWIEAALAPAPGERIAFDFAFLGGTPGAATAAAAMPGAATAAPAKPGAAKAAPAIPGAATAAPGAATAAPAMPGGPAPAGVARLALPAALLSVGRPDALRSLGS